MKKLYILLLSILAVVLTLPANAQLIKSAPKAEKPVVHTTSPSVIIPVSLTVHHHKHHKHRKHHRHHKHKVQQPLPTP